MTHQTAETSINCYHDHVKGFKEKTENKIIYDTIKRIQPCTGRMIQKETGIEIGDIARSLNNLWDKLRPAPIQIIHKRKSCPITGISVKWYGVNNCQTKLF